MMKRKMIAVILATITLALSGCAASNGSADKNSINENIIQNETSPAIEAAEEYAIDEEDPWAGSDFVKNESYSQGTESIIRADTSEKLVYRCSMTIETTDFSGSMKSLKEHIAKYSGIIEYEEKNDSNSEWYYSNNKKKWGTLSATITVRIPSADYEKFLEAADGIGKVINQNQNVENISSRYNDTSARIKALETQEKRLLEMMDKAETIEDMILIEDRLTEVESELNYYKTDLSSMDTDVAYSTVNLYINEVIEYTPDEDPGQSLTFGGRLSNTLANAWKIFKEVGEWVIYVIIYTAPFIIAGGIIAVIVILIIKKAIKKRRKNS